MKSAAEILLLCLLLVAAPSCIASQQELSEDYISHVYEWEINVTAKKLNRFLDFKSSKIAPAFDFTVSYRDFAPDREFTALVKHRQYLCGASRVLGCKTFSDFNFPPATQGVIRFCNQSGGTIECPWAVSSIIARLILDLNLRRTNAARIILPAGSVDSVASELARYGFYTFPHQPNATVVSHFLITLVSDPDGNERTMYYNGN